MDTSQLFALPTTIYGWIAIFAFIIAGVIFIRQNDIKSLRTANNDLRDLIRDKTSQINDLQVQIDKLKALVDKLQAVLAEKDKRIDALEHVQIVQSPSPEQMAYMSDSRNFMTQMHEFMIDMTKVMAQINTK